MSSWILRYSLKGHRPFLNNGLHDSNVGSLFSPDGEYLVATSWDHTVRVIELATGNVIGVNAQHSGNVSFAQHTSNSCRVFSTSVTIERTRSTQDMPPKSPAIQQGDGSARIWNYATGEDEFLLKHRRLGLTIASKDGKYLVAAVPDQSNCDSCRSDWQLWDTQAGTRHPVFLRHPLQHQVTLSFDPTNSYVFAREGGGQALDVWRISDGKIILRLKGKALSSPQRRSRPPGIYQNKFPSMVFPISATMFAISFRDDPMEIWDITKRERVRLLESWSTQANVAAISRCRRYLLLVTRPGHSHELYDIARDRTVARFLPRGFSSNSELSPDGTIVATARGDGADLWDSQSGELIVELVAPDVIGTSAEDTCAPKNALSNFPSIGFSPNGKYLVTGRQALHIWTT